MATQDRVVSIYPYFQVFDGKMEQFRDLCERFISATVREPECLYYGFSFHANEVHCREGYENAEALLAHLSNVDALLKEALTIAQLARLEIHGVAEELAKLTEPLATLAPTYFALEYGIRRDTAGSN